MQISLKKLIAVNFCILLTISTGMYVLAQTPTTTFWISPGVYPGSKTYTIWVEGSNYFSKDELGQIAYSGTNASYVISSSISNIGALGGTILIKAGIYYITHNITLRDRIQIIGESSNYGTWQNGTILEAQNNFNYIFAYDRASSGEVFIKIKDLTLAGADPVWTVTAGIGLTDCRNFELSGLSIRDFSSYGIYLLNCETFHIERNKVISNNIDGILIQGSNAIYMEDNQVSFNGESGIRIQTDTNVARIINNQAYLNAHYGLRFWSGNYDLAYITIAHNNFHDNAIRGIALDANMTHTEILFNRFYNNTSGAITGDLNNTFFWGNEGQLYLFDRGTGEAGHGDYLAFQDTFTYAPNVVLATVEESDARYILQVYEVNTTHFRVYLWDDVAGASEAVDKTINYYAEYVVLP